MNIQLVMGVVVLLLVLFLLMSRRKGSSGGGSFSLDFLPFGKKSAKGVPEAQALAEGQTAAAVDQVEMAPMAPPPAPPATSFDPSAQPPASGAVPEPAVPAAQQGAPPAPAPTAAPQAPLPAAAPQASPEDWATIQEPGWPSLGEMEGAWSAGSGAAASHATDPAAPPGVPAAQEGVAGQPPAPEAPPALDVPALADPAIPPAHAPVEDAMADWSPAQALATHAQEPPHALPPAAQEPAQARGAPASWSIDDPADAAARAATPPGPADQPTIEMSPPPAWDPPEKVGGPPEAPEGLEIPRVEIPAPHDALDEVSWAGTGAPEVAQATAEAEAQAAPTLDIAPPVVGGATLWDELGPTPDTATSTGDVEEPVAWWDEVDDEPEASDPSGALLFGRFALAGVASEAGQQAVCGVTFPEPTGEAPDPSRIHLAVAGAENCRHEDVEVMDKPGFEPSKEGFTVIAGSSDQGPFMVSGTYHVD